MRDMCECVCHTTILSLPFIKRSDCNSNSLTISRHKSYWISIVNSTIISYVMCPSDYCIPPDPPIDIDLNVLDGADRQCNFNRTGKLCGRCGEGLSLSLGSPRCIQCPKYWPALFIAITISACLAGVFLVALLLVCNLTVAAGTFNGLIFYANVIDTNQSLYLPFQKVNFHTVFVSWLNLDVGFNVCFINNMDTYLKTWLQLLFPIYLMFVVIAIMLISKYSVRFSHLISPRNPVATLATLILLSYTKLLDGVITALSFADISHITESADHQFIERAWLYDASVAYLRGRHIPLFIVAILILLLGLVYTFLLLFWQLIFRLPNRAIFRWTRNTKISSFIDAYHGPFTARNRYWTGLLLLARVVLHLTSAVHGSGRLSSGVNLLAVSLVMGCILLMQGYSGIRTYKKLTTNIFEFTSYFNILAFTSAKSYIQLTEGSLRDHTTIAYLSVGVEFLLFLFVIVHHVMVEYNLLHIVQRCIKHKLSTRIHLRELRVPFLDGSYSLHTADKVTHSEVSLDSSDNSDGPHNKVSLKMIKDREDTTALFGDLEDYANNS